MRMFRSTIQYLIASRDSGSPVCVTLKVHLSSQSHPSTAKSRAPTPPHSYLRDLPGRLAPLAPPPYSLPCSPGNPMDKPLQILFVGSDPALAHEARSALAGVPNWR